MTGARGASAGGAGGRQPADDLTFAHHLADVADAIALRHFQRLTGVRTKADGSVVTAADTEVDAALTSLIARRDPACRIISEESLPPGEPLPAGLPDGEAWVVDPIDQTTNFARGIEEFATLVAHCSSGAVVCAVVSAPAMGRRWWAVRGGGAFTRSRRPADVAGAGGPREPGEPGEPGGAPRRLRVSSGAELSDAVLSVAPVHRFARHRRLDAVLGLCGDAAALTGNGGFLAHMRVAEGSVDLALDPWGQLWDLAATSLVVQEAGGFFGGLDGTPGPQVGWALAGGPALARTAAARLTSGG